MLSSSESSRGRVVIKRSCRHLRSHQEVLSSSSVSSRGLVIIFIIFKIIKTFYLSFLSVLIWGSCCHPEVVSLSSSSLRGCFFFFIITLRSWVLLIVILNQCDHYIAHALITGAACAFSKEIIIVLYQCHLIDFNALLIAVLCSSACDDNGDE